MIAEVKRRSPSAGNLNADADAVELARQYCDGGAACLSVLTDGPRFGGSPEDLQQARAATGIPVLRKDFLTTLEHVRESSAMGADAMLVIVDDVDGSLLRPMHELALELGLDVLTEIRNEPELERAVEAGAYMIAVNQRSQPKASSFTVDYNKAVAMGPRFAQLGSGTVTVAASGIGVEGGTTMAEIAEAGYDAALIGEALVTAADPAARLRALLADAARAYSAL
ncbi:MAG: indole-3-glycerol-phosphate synthase [Acidobacteria bacterium]|nr:indole-3-glycerol-phosphate synthase [Acidobacteriota bacterium]